MAQKNPSVANIEADILTHLKKTIPIETPVEVYEPMHYLIFAAPRTAAPVLRIAACELVEGDSDQAIAAAAAAIHLVHAAAYTHENLPLTDRTRPKPPIQHKYKPNVGLLTGDGIMPFGFELLARSMDSAKNNADRILRVIVEITQAAGSQGWSVQGIGRYQRLEIDMELIEYVCKKREGELHACGAACGATLGGGSEEIIEKLRKYGLYAGTVQELLHGVGRNRDGTLEIVKKSFIVKELRALAMEELEIFKIKKIETICSFLKT